MTQKLFLFSVDVEDFKVSIHGKPTLAGGVRRLNKKYLDLLKKFKLKATFFVLAEVVLNDPLVLTDILEGGHEIGCHGFDHAPLDQLDPMTFSQQLKRFLDVLKDRDVNQISGYRAPYASLTRKTQWAYQVLRDHGFKYSSSVIPKYNPLYGWPGFGTKPKLLDGIWEIPISIVPALPVGIPFAAGAYFRVLPLSVTDFFITKTDKTVCYFHPYDCDENLNFKSSDGNLRMPFAKSLINLNKKTLLPKLEQILSRKDTTCMTYERYVQQL